MKCSVIKVATITTSQGQRTQIQVHIPDWGSLRLPSLQNGANGFMRRGDIELDQENLSQGQLRQSIGVDRGPIASILLNDPNLAQLLQPGDTILVEGVPIAVLGKPDQNGENKPFLNFQNATVFPSLEVIGRAVLRGVQAQQPAPQPRTGGVPLRTQPVAEDTDNTPF